MRDCAIDKMAERERKRGRVKGQRKRGRVEGQRKRERERAHARERERERVSERERDRERQRTRERARKRERERDRERETPRGDRRNKTVREGERDLRPVLKKRLQKNHNTHLTITKTLVPYKQKHPSGVFLCLGSRIFREHTATHRNTLQRTAHCNTL